jgi:hypothetical protein
MSVAAASVAAGGQLAASVAAGGQLAIAKARLVRLKQVQTALDTRLLAAREEVALAKQLCTRVKDARRICAGIMAYELPDGLRVTSVWDGTREDRTWTVEWQAAGDSGERVEVTFGWPAGGRGLLDPPYVQATTGDRLLTLRLSDFHRQLVRDYSPAMSVPVLILMMYTHCTNP